MSILITGGTGFLGSYLTRYTLREGGQSRVVVLDRYPDRARIADVLDRVTVIEDDVSDPETVRSAIADHDVERIAHFAFILGSPAAGRMLPYVDVQCVGTANVLEAARLAGVRRVVLASSVAAYGKQSAEVLTEDLVADPQDLYGSCKLWTEFLARHYAETLGLDTVSLRYGSTYGLGRAWRGSYNSGLLDAPRSVHYMARIEQAARGEAIVMPADEAMADWTYAGDAAQAAWLALTAPDLPHRLYNVSGERLAVGAFTEVMRALLPDAAISVSASETPGHAHAPMANARLVADLGFAPAYDFRTGLADYLDRIAVADRYLAADR